MKTKRVVYKCPRCSHFITKTDKDLAKITLCPKCKIELLSRFIPVELK